MTKLLLSIHVIAAILAIGPVAVAASRFPAATRRLLAATPADAAEPASAESSRPASAGSAQRASVTTVGAAEPASAESSRSTPAESARPAAAGSAQRASATAADAAEPASAEAARPAPAESVRLASAESRPAESARPTSADAPDPTTAVPPAAMTRAIDAALAVRAEHELSELRTLHKICRLYAVVGIVVPAFGLATARSLDVLGDPWLIISITLTALAAAVLVLLVLPGQQSVLTDTPNEKTPARLAMHAGLFNLLWATVTVLMITRPGSTTGV